MSYEGGEPSSATHTTPIDMTAPNDTAETGRGKAVPEILSSSITASLRYLACRAQAVLLHTGKPLVAVLSVTRRSYQTWRRARVPGRGGDHPARRRRTSPPPSPPP
eukprot:TRINITY_DN58755_c0_g1_i1.p3 TRINITY_DN58755_c0_g1~~TRINITY_DN58755_c0_g1_i1.p3  ORF type:complete len:106 (-),score=8.60 TRINITY_DN58755_c0_g1_i1:54-371(-)